MLVDNILIVFILSCCSDVINLTGKLLALKYWFLLLIYRQKKSKDMKHSSSLSKEANRRSGKSGLPDQRRKTKYGAGEGVSVADADLPERIKVVHSKFLLITSISVVNLNFLV
jgi:hypothetical protein